MFPDIGKEVGQAGYQEVVFRNNVNKEVFRNLLHLEMEVSHKTDEQVGELGHGLDAGAEQSNKVFPLFKTIIVLGN